MRGACKLRCKRRCLAAPYSHARGRYRGGDIRSQVSLLLVILVVVFSFVPKMMSADGLDTITIIVAPKKKRWTHT